MASNLRVDNIQPSTGMGIGIGTANGSVTFNADVTGGLNVSTGLVGVGTDNPAEKLEVYGNARFKDPDGSHGIEFYPDIAGLGYQRIISYNRTSSAYESLSIGVNNFIVTQGSSTEIFRANSGGDVQIANGNLVFSTSGTGIDFSATGGPSDGADTSELLSDYEEGTFTPLFGASVTNPTYTASLADGYYTKIGNQVTCWGLIIVTGTPTNGSGNWYVTSFPYSAATGTSYRQNGIIGYNDVLTNEVNKMYIVPGASFCQIIPNGVTQSNETYNSNAITSGYFGFTISYFTD